MNKDTITIPAVHSFKQIRERAVEKAKAKKTRTVLVAPHESAMVSSFVKAANENLIDPIIIGDENLFRKEAKKNSIDCADYKFIDLNEPDKAVQVAGKMAVAGEVDLIVKGRMSAEEFLKHLFEKQIGFVKRGKTVSHIGLFQPKRYKKLLMITDGAVNVKNDLKTLIAITQNSINFAKCIGIDMPRIAVLAAVEVVYPQMDSTLKGAVLSKMAERNQIKNAYIDGPLSFDCAMDMEAAIGKGIKNSEVAGQADVMIAPDIDTGNGIYKAMSLYGDVEMGGIVIGGLVPVTLSAFIDNETTRYNSILMGILAS